MAKRWLLASASREGQFFCVDQCPVVGDGRRKCRPCLRRAMRHRHPGMYVNRYETANQVHDKIGVPVMYVVGSPSSYAYPDSFRPEPGGVTFGLFADASNCTTFDRWSYGLAGRTGYASKLTNDQIQRQLVSRPVTYLVGELETPQSPALDLACPAMAQGASCLTRAQAFFKQSTGCLSFLSAVTMQGVSLPRTLYCQSSSRSRNRASAGDAVVTVRT